MVRRVGSDPTNNRLKDLRTLCQRCQMLHDRSHHLEQRWITYRRRRALGDLFLGSYAALIAALRLNRQVSFPDFRLWHRYSVSGPCNAPRLCCRNTFGLPFLPNSANTPSMSRKAFPAAVPVSIGCSVARKVTRRLPFSS